MYSMLSGVIGALTAVMVYVNGGLASYVGNHASNLFVHLSGLCLVAVVLALTRSKTPLRSVGSPLLLSGGVLGFVTVACANIGFLSLGVSLTVGLGLLGQTISALAFDHVGWLGAPIVPLNRGRAGSLVLIVCGIAMIAWW